MAISMPPFESKSANLIVDWSREVCYATGRKFLEGPMLKIVMAILLALTLAVITADGHARAESVCVIYPNLCR